MNITKEVREFKEYLKGYNSNLRQAINLKKIELEACKVVAFRYVSDETDPRGYKSIEHKTFKKEKAEKELEGLIANHKELSMILRTLLDDRVTEISIERLGTAIPFLLDYVDQKNKSIEVFSRIFGMFVSASPLSLAQAFNRDGTFTIKISPSSFEDCFFYAFGDLFELLSKRADFNVLNPHEYVEYACESILEEYGTRAARAFADKVENSIDKAFKTEKADIAKDCRKKLKRYYSDGKIIAIPEDMEAFEYILNNSNLSSEKIKEILQKLKEYTEAEKLPATNLAEMLGENAGVYEYYLKFVSESKQYDERYYDISKQVSLITEAINFWQSNQNDSELVELAKEEIKEPLETLLDYKICDTPDDYKNGHLHFIFKDDDCDLIADFEEIQSKYYNQISSVVRKINDSLLKDSCYFIGTNGEKISFLNTKFFRVYYKEIVQGEYVILAITKPNVAHNAVNRRINSYQKELERLKKALEDNTFDLQYAEDCASIVRMLLESGENSPKLSLVEY